MQDEDIDLSDIPEVTEEQMKQAVLRVGGKPVKRSQQRVDILLDAFIVEYFKTKAGEQGYQVLINQALAEYILAKTVDLSVSEVNETIPD
ncbi:BrnA antitoxin family protein [uncultured Nostoc sp.]|uniref:BrnA antitoxin family protein n=1 Tax=uncultured Nostoc sp. TaxID=340711 RepID=UPI0035CA93A5